MSTRKTVFYALLIAVASLAVGMVIASRLDLSPASSAQTAWRRPQANSAPIGRPVDASTFRNIAKAQTPMVVNIRTESRQRTQDLTEFFGGGDDLFRRFFSLPERAQDPRSSSAQTIRWRRPPAPASSSARTASSSPTTTSSRARPRSRSRFCTATTTS